MQTEIGLRADVRRGERERAPRERNGLVEAIETRRQIAGNAIRLAERRVDGEHARHLGLERRLVIADIGDGAEQGPRFQMRGVRLEHAVDPFAGGGVSRVVELELGEE